MRQKNTLEYLGLWERLNNANFKGEMDLRGIDWIIVGGESGPKARPMRLEWVINIKQQVERHGAAFFFKQWGTWGSDGIKRNKHANGKLLLGEVIQQMPRRIAM